MRIRLNPHSGEPIWRQIVEQVKYAVAAGELAGGEQLPSIRVLAGELKVNPRTVVKAYEELRHLGVVILRQGQGAFVDDRSQDAPVAARRRLIAEQGRRLFAEGLRMGATPGEVLDVLRDVSGEFES